MTLQIRSKDRWINKTVERPPSAPSLDSSALRGGSVLLLGDNYAPGTSACCPIRPEHDGRVRYSSTSGRTNIKWASMSNLHTLVLLSSYVSLYIYGICRIHTGTGLYSL